MNKIFKKTLIYLGLTLWLVIAILPFVWMFLSSFKPIAEVLSYPPTLWPKRFTFDNYVKAFTLIPYLRYIINSVIITGVATCSVIILSTMAAYSITILKVPGAGLFIPLVLLGLLVPPQSGFIPIFMFVRKLGLVDTYAGVILPYLATPFGVFLLTQFFKVIPLDIIDAARIDGLGELGIVRHVILPLGRPGIITLAIFTFMGVWRDFFWPFILINSEHLRTVPLGVVAFWQAESQHWGQILAVSTIAMLPLVIVYLIFQRQFIKGISWSGLKM